MSGSQVSFPRKGFKQTEYTAPGTYSFNVPSGVREMYVLMCGGGAGGTGGFPTQGGNGGAAAQIFNSWVKVTPLSTLTINVGTGGAGSSPGGGVHNPGTSTTITGTFFSRLLASGGSGQGGGGTGEGYLNNIINPGADSQYALGGVVYGTISANQGDGGGGAACLGNGGRGSDIDLWIAGGQVDISLIRGGNGDKGSGGGGGVGGTGFLENGGKGGDGYVLLLYREDF
ncbi:MAG: hypothetical protein ACRCW1_05890 [Anaerotignaceae bacterium]